MTVKINADTSDGLKFVSDTSGAIDLQSNGTTKVSLDSSGNLEVNNGNFIIDKSSSPNLLFNVNGTEKGYIRQNANDLESNSASGNVLFRTGGTERARIDSSGILLVGTSSLIDSTKNSIGQFANVNGGRPALALGNLSGSTESNVIIFKNSNGEVGTINTSGSGTAYATSSDYRLKENVSYTFDATSRLKQLKPARFNFKADADTTLDGFLAHEVSSIVPEAVIGEKDGVQMQGIDQSKLVPLLVKTCQEQQTIIEDLQTRIQALES
ncbi:MAG: hypothetical protein CMI75_08510 [Candidatus Pelagibacter sp.]|nr:hypothetical protein [Candidatus Pelagibacter sp.]